MEGLRGGYTYVPLAYVQARSQSRSRQPAYAKMSPPYDALLWLSFGGPNGPEDVLPFLENVTKGRHIPRERLETVAKQYLLFGGVSPLNAQNEALIASLGAALEAEGLRLPLYLGNRNWSPYVAQTASKMADDGITNALVFVTSPYGSYSGCRQYREDIRAAEAATRGRLRLTKLRHYFNHPGFLLPLIDGTVSQLTSLKREGASDIAVITTAHSIPEEMAVSCEYEAQLTLVRTAIREGIQERMSETFPVFQAYQSRSGAPAQKWLEPDIIGLISKLHNDGYRSLVVIPTGFISDHQEVRYDLDCLARSKAEELSMTFDRVPTSSSSELFIAMIVELVKEQLDPTFVPRALLGTVPKSDCAIDCCL